MNIPYRKAKKHYDYGVKRAKQPVDVGLGDVTLTVVYCTTVASELHSKKIELDSTFAL